MYEEKVRDWKDKPLHGVFVRDTEEISAEESWKWLRNGYLKKETEGIDLRGARTGPENQLSQVPHRQDK